MLLLLPISCFANIDDIYIRMNGKVTSFKDIISQSNGSISPVDNNKYRITIDNKQAVIDFSSGKQVRATLGFLYPGKPIIEISFAKVKPNTIAFFDDDEVAKIDSFGNSDSDKFQVDTDGKHTVFLKKMEKTVDFDKINIERSSLISCVGKAKMKCTVVSD